MIELGPFGLDSPIGKGGMGQVYKATDIRLNRVVAVKVLPEPFAADADRRERFEREYAEKAGQCKVLHHTCGLQRHPWN